MKVWMLFILLYVLVIGCTEYDSAPYPYDHPETWNADEPPYSGWEWSGQFINIEESNDYINGMKKGGWELVSCQPSIELPQKYWIVMRKKKSTPSVEKK